MSMWSEIENDEGTPVQKLGRLAGATTFEGGPEPVDVGFLQLSVDRVAKHEVEKALDAALTYAEGEFNSIDAAQLRQGPSYIEIGAWLGSQTLALQLMALLKHFELADIVTPATLGITGEQAKELMGNGFLMLILKSSE